MRASVSPLRIVRRCGPPLLIVIAAAYWFWEGVHIALYMPLGGDHGIFQYLAWAMRHGERMYADYREVNGPGTAVMHIVFQWLGAEDDEYWFRTLDLTGNALSFAFIGACLPGLMGTWRKPELVTPASWWTRLGWALASVVALMSIYLHLGFWGTAQRESFAMWFLLPSLGLQLLGLGTYRGEAHEQARRRQRIQLGASGALSALVWFFKPTFVVFTCVQVLCVLAARGALSRRERLLVFAGSTAACALVAALAVTPVADLSVWLSYLREAREYYRFIWNAPILKSWSGTASSLGAQALVIAGLGSIAIVQRVLPARLLAIVLAPLAAAAHVTLQHKGFQYHFLPVMVLVRVGWMALAIALGELTLRSVRDPRLARTLALVPLMGIAFQAAETAASNGNLKLAQIHDPADPAYEIGSYAYYALFQSRHTPFLEQIEAASYLRKHTRESDRIQVYGRDPWVLFLARRFSATPYLYATDLNVQLALKGSGLVVPNAEERDRIRDIGAAHDADLLARLKARPPAKLLFIDGMGLMPMPDAAKNFREHVPLSAQWVFERYAAEKTFGPIRIYGKKP